MINALKKILPAFLLSLSAMGVSADQNIEIEQQVTLAVDKQLELPDGSALSIVRTGPLTDDGGNLLKGRHQLFFTNKAESTIPVVVNNINVSPGETVEFTVNLSLTSNRLYFPIYPAVAGAAGEIFYDINLPSLSITNCPTEYTELPSNACEKVEVAAGEYVCPDTYTNAGTECSLEKTITINSACPIDFALVDGECVKEDKLSATESCESGYRLNGDGLCEQNVLYPMEFTCPDGYALDSNNVCKRTYSIEPGETCSSGYIRVGEQCERVLELAVGACEAGFALKSGECFELKVPLDVCPHGYTQVGENCELLEANTPTLDCPAGYALNADNQCVDRTEILVSGVACPPDAVNDNGVCKKVEYFEQDVKCGTGQYFDGSKCIEEVVKPIPQCQEGWVLISGNCYEKHGYELICPDGFTYADDHCERVDIINKQQCPDGYTFNEQEQNCYKTIVGDAIESCPQDYALVDGKCQRESVLDPVGCSTGHVLNDGRCYDIVLVDYVCPDGFTKKAGQCEKVSTTELSTRCPDEYKEVNGQCEKLITTDAVQSCATPGYYIENEECLKVTEAAAKQCEAGYTMIDGLCYRTQEPMYFCDNDFVLSADKTTCTKEQVKDAFQTCPETFENVGGVCERRSTITPELECPVGYEPANGRCEMQVEIVASQCPEGAFYKEDGTCAVVKELVLTCPSNMTLKQGACYERIFKAKDTCKAGFVYSNGECFELLGEEKVCEAGQEAVTVAGITLCKTLESKTFCADGFYFDGNACVDNDGKRQSRQDYCPDGFTYSNQGGIERCTSDENLTLTKASLSCPEGATSVSSSDCLSLCPEGYQDNNGTCESVSLVDFESTICLEGEMVDGRCWVSESRSAGLSGYICPVGTENASPYINDSTKRRGYSKSCVKTITASKEQVCMSDLGVTGPACVINGSKEFVAAEVCPEGFVVNKEGECAVVEHAENACDGVSFNGPNSSSLDTYVNDKGACVSYVEVEQQEAYVCPTGFKPVYNYEGHALPAELNPKNVVNEAVSSDVWTAFEAQWSTVNFISSTSDDAHQVKGTPKIKDFLCVSDTVTFIEADLGESPEHTFNAIFDGTKDYGIEGQSLVDNVSNMAARYQDNYVSGIDSAGEIYNYEFLKAIVRGNSKASINGYAPSLSINGNSGIALSAPGTEEVKEFIKLYPVKGHEDKFIIASMLMAGNVEGQSHDAGDYVSRAIQSNKPSMIDIVGGCSVNSEKLVKNIASYNAPLYDFITSAGGFVVDTDSFVSEQNEESCYITYQHQGSLSKQCPSGMKMNALGQCETLSGIPQAQSCEAISQVSVDYKCPAGTKLSSDGKSCITKTYSPAYSCETGEYQSETGLCVRNAECKDGYNVYGELCGKPIDCNEVLGIEGSTYDSTMNICRSKKYRESAITNTAVPTCEEGEVLDQTNAMCTYPYETATVPATLACSADQIEGDQCVSEVAIPASASQSIELSEFNRTTGQCNTYFVQAHDASEVYCDSAREPLFINGNWYCAEDEPAEPAIPVCPSGYKQSSAGSSNCIKDNITKPQEKPVKGSQLIKGFYVSNSPEASALLCGGDTVWNGSQCEQLVKSSVSPTVGACEGVIEYGFDKNGSKTLICQVSTQPAICDAGYTMGEQGVCERVEIHEVNNICPDDFTFDGVHCQRLETENVVFSCPEDMTLVSEEEGCKGVVSQPSTVQCPEGESLVNGLCINTDTDDFVAMCDAPLTYDAINDNCRLEEIEPIVYDCGPNQVLNGYVCEELLVETIIEECPAQFVQNGQCIKTEKVPMIAECPLGYSDQGANCVSSVDNANAIVCPNGSRKVNGTSICEKIETTRIIFSCPAPYDLKNGNECHRVVVESSKDQCPSGYRLTENGQCERLTVTQGATFCASGFTYNDQEKRCERLVETSVSSCPENYKLVSGRCYPTYSSKIECPNNFTLNNNGKCVNNAVSPLDTICPNGWRAGGNGQCYKLETTSGSKACPTGYYFENGVCVEDVFTDINGCPEGFSFVDGQCKETSPVLYSCPNGWTKDGDKCERTLVQPVSSCPSGYTKQGDYCHAVKAADESCPSGYVNGNDGTCYRDESANISSCPSGYIKQGNYCRRLIDAGQSCPSGYINDGNGTCYKEEDTVIASCPSGYVKTGDYCRRVIDANQNCPSGYTNGNDGKCYSEQATSVSSCPSGYVKQGSLCHRVINANMNCPSGYSRSGTTCKKDESISATPNCPSGYTRSGSTCSKTETKPATPNCPSGYTRSGSSCNKTQTISATGTCPSGFTSINATQCKKTTSYRSSYSCPDNSQWNALWGECRGIVYADPIIWSCPANSDRVPVESTYAYFCKYKPEDPRSSYDFDVVYATALCPSGYQQSGKQCYKDTGYPAEATCPDGGTLNGDDCVVTEIVDKSFSCPSGYTKSGTSCTRTVTQPVTYSCPSGYTKSGTSCTRTLTQPVSYSCPAGYTLDGSSCDRTLSQPVTYSCPSGYSSYNTSKCKSNSPTYSVGVCPSGYSLNTSNGSCERTLTQNVTFSCPSGYSLYNGDQCRSNSNSLNVGNCPAGYDLNTSNGKCERTLTENVVYYCSNQYTIYDVDMCKAKTPTYSVGNCPSGGYTLNASTGICERTLTNAVTYYCGTSGYSLFQTVQCKKNNPTYSVGSCPSGYVRNNSTGYCDRYENKDATEYCLAGNELESINCPTQTCEPGYSLVNGQCTQVNEFPIASCDSGYAKLDNECFKTQNIQMTCPAGYQYANGQCSLKSTDAGVKTCKAGHALVNGSCFKLMNKVAQCSSPYTLEDGFCKSVQTSNPLGCKEGYVGSGTNCRLVVSTLNICPEDYVYNEEYKLCIRVDNCDNVYGQTQCASQVYMEVPTKGCASYASFVGDVCAINYPDLSGVACPDGMTFSGDSRTCEKVTSIAPTEVCPSGSVNYSETQCRITSKNNAAVICEGASTYNSATGQCEVESTADVTPTCSSGYVQLNSTQCRSINPTLNAGNCPSGMTLKADGMCDQVKTSAPVNLCPDGVTGTMSQCRSTSGSNTGLCPTGYIYENGRCKDTRELNNVLSCPDTHFYSNGKCYPMTPKFNACPSGYSLNGEQCERVGTTTVTTNCKDGFVKSNGMCVKETKRSFVNCQTGFALSNNGSFKSCHKIEKSLPTCPENMGLVDGMCKQVVVTDIQNVCFDGYSQLNSTTCFKDLFTPRFFGCPTSHPDTYVPNRTMCTNGTEQVVRQPTCAEGTVFDASEGMCRERLTQPILKQCPLEYTMKNGTCIKEVEQHPLNAVKCPAGYVQRVGQSEVCQSVPDYPEKGLCPTGTEREGRVCINTETYDPQESCPTGFAKVGDSCMRTLVSQVDRECLIGNSHDLHYCKDTTAVNNLGFGYKYNCPAGYKAKGQSCYRIVTRSIDSVCQSGQVITPEGCRTINEVAHVDTCPSGQQLLADGVCRSTTSQNGAAECADGYVSTGNGKCYKLDWQSPSVNCSIGENQGLNCFNFEEIVAEPDCPYGYQFNGSQCQKIEIENIVKVCKSEFGVLNNSYCREIASTNIQANCGPNAYFSTDNQRCIERKELPRSTNCPSGMTYNQDTGFCQSVTVVPSDPLNGFVCPAGYWYETEREICVSYQESASKTLFTCPSGYTIHHNECRKTGNVNATYTCPEDTVMVDTVSKMCAYTALDLKLGSCPAGFIYNTTLRICTSDERIKAQASCPSDSLLTSTGQCRRVLDSLPVTKQCTAPFKDVDGYFNCVKELTAVATPSCPSGYVYHTGISRCVDENIESKIIVCENGYALNAENARCEKLITKPVDKQCDDRFVLEDGQCISVLPNESVSICDTGFLYDPESDQCVQHQVTEIVYTCPTDYSFDDALKACVRTDNKNAIEDCPTGFVLTDDKKSCVKTKEMAASPACPDNYELNGTECTLVIKKAPATACPDNFTKRGVNECVSIEEANPITLCGEGYDFVDGQCTKTDFKPIERCAAGYRVIDGGCYQTELATFDCPAGTSLTRNDNDELVCRFYQTLSNTISCPLGEYSWIKQGCVDVDTDELLTESIPMCLPVEFGQGELARGEFDKVRNRCIHQKEYPAGEYMNTCSGDLIQHDDVYCRAVTADNEKVIPPFGYEYDELTGYVKKELVSSADILCHDGFSLQGGTCKKETVVEPTASTCPEGFTATGSDTCEMSDTMEALFVCPEGYLDIGNNQCQRRIILPAL